MIEHEPYCEGGHTADLSCSVTTTMRKEARARERPVAPPDVAFELSQYERDNLLALMAAVCLHTSPLRVANNGDWAKQILAKLGYAAALTDWGRPNLSAEQLVENARAMVTDR